MTTQADIRRWFAQGIERGATHLVVATDTFDWSDYPKYVSKYEDARALVEQTRNQSMTKVMEVYNLSMDIDVQIGQHRAWNF